LVPVDSFRQVNDDTWSDFVYRFKKAGHSLIFESKNVFNIKMAQSKRRYDDSVCLDYGQDFKTVADTKIDRIDNSVLTFL
jgi:hypothetical protein